MLSYLFIFGLSDYAIRNKQPTRLQTSDFGGISKTLTISCLNFIDTI
ncbi:hypothetical protein HMPREF6485_2367 [Segatella buccae ATCC 33574]|uniref:Uncharacterized protein n=1 Tax=Segatella buccae ATCC 33574 TaxID=873513 RepID=E6K9S3_9BACT|nr:hypothetical protein HMPREF6485_2367 [Segatella buccae ATCC 33574]